MALPLKMERKAGSGIMYESLDFLGADLGRLVSDLGARNVLAKLLSRLLICLAMVYTFNNEKLSAKDKTNLKVVASTVIMVITGFSELCNGRVINERYMCPLTPY